MHSSWLLIKNVSHPQNAIPNALARSLPRQSSAEPGFSPPLVGNVLPPSQIAHDALHALDSSEKSGRVVVAAAL